MQINTNNYTANISNTLKSQTLDKAINSIKDHFINNTIENSISNIIIPNDVETSRTNYDNFFESKQTLDDSTEVTNSTLSQNTNHYILNRTVIQTNGLEELTQTEELQELFDTSNEQKKGLFNEIRNTLFSNSQNQKNEEEYLNQLHKTQYSNNLLKNEIQAYTSAHGLEAQTHMILMLTQQTVSSDISKQNSTQNY